MKRNPAILFISILICFSFILSTFFAFALPIYANPGVTIRGTVRYWNLEGGGIIIPSTSDFANISGGSYRPLRDTYIEVELSKYTISDIKLKTDSDGKFSVSVRNPNPIESLWNFLTS